MRVLRTLFVAAICAAGLVVSVGTPAAATIPVTTTEDESVNDGDCSLREAVESINLGVAQDACAEATGPVVLAAASTYQVASEITVAGTVTIDGQGAGSTVIEWTGGASTGTVFDVNNGGDFVLNAVSMIGSADFYVEKQCDGNTNSLTVNGSVLSAPGLMGVNACNGAIALNRTTIENAGSNGANSLNGAISLTDALISGSAQNGVNNLAGPITLVRSTIAGSAGNHINTTSAAVSLTNSTLAGPGRVGINTNDGVVTLESVTIVGPYTSFALDSNVAPVITNSIVTGGEVATCDIAATSNGFNISDDDSCSFDAASDRQNTDPVLGPLADNGGFTPTFLPLSGSPAIDTGGDCPSEDQRGLPRPSDGNDDGVVACDRGSVELQAPTPPVPLTPNFTG